MHVGAVARILGVFVMVFSVALLPPAGVALLYDDGQVALFLGACGLVLSIGFLLWFPCREYRNALSIRDGFLIVALFWTVLGFLGAVPLLPVMNMDYADAVFEAVSGFTTTGATVIVGLDGLPPSVLYYRQQLQWMGGMGVVVLAVAILPMLGVGGIQLYRAEVSGIAKDEKLTPRITQTARALWGIYLGLTVACALAYWAVGMEVFDAISHAFSTVATGGFSTHDASLGHYDSLSIELVACLFMLLGAINFALHFLVWRRRTLAVYVHDPEARAFLVLVAASVIIVTATLVVTGYYSDVSQGLRYAVFQVVSVITSTGYGTAVFAEWPLYTPLLLAMLSFIGGCAGSTAGGMKVVRMQLLTKQGGRQIFALLHPRGVSSIKLGRRLVPEDVVQSVWGFYVLYILAALLLTVVMMGAGLDLESAFGAVVASLNLLGPGLGEVASTFATVNDAVKWVAVFAMLLGRLEVFTLLVIFTFMFWND